MATSYADSPTQQDEAPKRDEFPAFGSPKHRSILKRVTERFEDAEEGKKPHDDIARRSYKHLRAYIDPKKWQFDTRIYPPKYTADLLTHVAREVQAVLQAPPPFRYLPRGGARFEQAKQMTDVVAYFTDVIPIWERYRSALLQRRMFGTAWAHTHWRTEERIQAFWERTPVIDPLTGQPLIDPFTGEVVEAQQFNRTRRTTYDGPWFTVLHWSEAFPDYMKETLRDDDLNSDTFFCTRHMRPAKYLKAKAASGEWSPKMVRRALKSPITGQGSSFDGKVREALFQTLDWQAQVGLSKPHDQDCIAKRQWFEVVEMWTPETHTVVVNRAYVVLHRPNPFPHGRIPFVQLRNYHVPGEHYGMSDFELLESLITANVDMKNVEATNALYSAFPMMKHGPQINTRQLRYGIGAKIMVQGKEDVLEFMQHPPMGVDLAMKVRQSNSFDMDQTSGLSDALRGSGNTRGETTATEASIAAQGAGLRSQDSIDTIDHTFTRDIADDFQWMIRAWLPHDVQVRITGDPMAPPMLIPIDELRDCSFTAIPTASSNQARLLQEKRMEQMYQLFVTTQEPNVDRRQLTRMYLELVFPEYAERILKPEQQVLMEQQQAMMMAANDPRAQGQNGSAGIVPGAQAQGRQVAESPPEREDPRMGDMSEMANDMGAEMR